MQVFEVEFTHKKVCTNVDLWSKWKIKPSDWIRFCGLWHWTIYIHLKCAAGANLLACFYIKILILQVCHKVEEKKIVDKIAHYVRILQNAKECAYIHSTRITCNVERGKKKHLTVVALTHLNKCRGPFYPIFRVRPVTLRLAMTGSSLTKVFTSAKSCLRNFVLLFFCAISYIESALKKKKSGTLGEAEEKKCRVSKTFRIIWFDI